jgi:hypothetical protein
MAAAVALLPLVGCTGEPVIGPSIETAALAASFAVMSPGGVSNLSVVTSTDSTVTLSWTQISDGAGSPASYRVKYSTPAIVWGSAAIACSTVQGTLVGAKSSCTARGLSAGTRYDFQLMSYRLVGGVWKNGLYSNVATGQTTIPTRPAGTVRDLAVIGTTESSLTVGWTQVDDGAGAPASYRVKYALPSISWSTATIGCASTISGTQVGAAISCTIEGLASGTTYEVQLNSFRLVAGVWQGTTTSNIASGVVSDGGIWASPSRLRQLPTSGAAWDKLVSDAARDPGLADISNQDSNHDVYTMAAALVCVRNGQYCTKARDGVLSAIGTELSARWLAVGRNLTGYIIAADLLDLRADGVSTSAGTRVETWIEGWLTKQLPDNNTGVLRGFEPFKWGANAAAQEGLTYTAVAAFLEDDWALERAWDAFRTFTCDPSAPDRENINLDPAVADGWTHNNVAPCAINPIGTTKVVPAGVSGAGSTRRIDGALGGDMRRGGTYQWVPAYTQYAWVGLEGVVPAAVILDHAGYPAFDVADRAVLRTHEYLWHLRTQTGDVRWFDGIRAREIIHLVNAAYGSSFPLAQVVGAGRTVGYTEWTHPRP